MKKTTAILTAALALLALSACEKYSASGEEEEYKYVKRETTTIKVSALLDPDGKADATAASEEEALSAAGLWQWGSEPSVNLFYSCDNMTAVQSSASATVDGDVATFTFEDIPVEATPLRLVLGSELVFAQTFEEITPEYMYAVGEISAEAGQTEISGVKMVHQCNYFDVYMPYMTIEETRIDVSSISMTGNGLLGRGTEDAVEIGSVTEMMWVAVNRAATGLSIVAHVPGKDYTMMELTEGTSVTKLIRVRDFNDPDECVELTVTGTLDAGLSGEAEDLRQWSTDDVVYASYSIGSYNGSCKSDTVTPDASDPAKGTIHFPLVPKDAVISSLSVGTSEAFGQSGETFTRDMLYCTATGFTHTASASAIDGAEFKSECSYVRIEAASVLGSPVTKVSLSGKSLKGADAEVTLLPEWDAEAKWVAVSNKGADVSVCAFTEAGEYIIATLPDCGAGSCRLYKVDCSDPFAVYYRTVLYADGTLIINERSTDIEANETAHGAAEFECDPYDGTNYVCTSKGASEQPWYEVQQNITAVKFGSLVQPKNMGYWFFGCANLASFDATNLDTSICTRMDALFQNAMTASGLSVDLDLSGFDVSGVSNSKGLQNVFYKATGIHSIDVSGWVVKNGVGCTNMFSVQSKNFTTIYADTKTNFGAVTSSNSTNMFKNDTGLVGGNGTLYNASNVNASFARIDKADSPGYFTLKL